LPSRFNDLLHQRLQQSRCLHCCPDCYRVERTSSRAGLTPAVDHRLFTAHPISGLTSSPLLRPAELLASLTETFTSGLLAVRSPSPPPDMTTVPTGQFTPVGLSPTGTAASVAARALLGSWEIPLETYPELTTPAIPGRPSQLRSYPDAAFHQTEQRRHRNGGRSGFE
jgi:hypothetical protein